jgi:voltage-gated potassium channel
LANSEPPPIPPQEEETIEKYIDDILELPMFILAMVMLVLFIIEITAHLSPQSSRILVLAQSIIWWIFVAEYLLRVFLADDRIIYIKEHPLDALFILVPFLRVFRVLMVFRTIRLLRVIHPSALLKTYVTTRRSLRQLGNILERRSFGYVVASTIVVTLIGSLIMYLLERNAARTVIHSFGDAVWWAVGIVTTVGNELYPVTAEGRVLSTIMMVYGMGIFGYIAATIASYFIHMDNPEPVQKDGEITQQEYKDLNGRLDEMLAEIKKTSGKD